MPDMQKGILGNRFRSVGIQNKYKNAAVFVYLLPYFSEKKSIQHGEINSLAAGEIVWVGGG